VFRFLQWSEIALERIYIAEKLTFLNTYTVKIVTYL